MSDEMAQKLLQGGIKAARSGQKDLARKAFLQVLKLQPENEAAWLGMATVSDDPKDKLRILKKILEINPANAQAKEALRRLGVEPEQVIDSAPKPEPIAEPPLEEPPLDDIPLPPIGESPLDDIPFPPIGEPPLDDIPFPPIDEPPLPTATDSAPPGGGLKSLQSLRKLEPPADRPVRVPETDIPAPDLDDLGLPPLETYGEPEPETVDESAVDLDVPTLEEAFAMLPPLPQGRDGIPIPSQAVIETISQRTWQDVQAYLERSLAGYEDITWEMKKRGRAGESEYGVFLAQVGAAIFVFLLVVGGATTVAILNSPQAQSALFGPTHTPTHTPTVTPTHTPGPTNTASPSPQASPTASPTLRPVITPGNPDPNFPPQPTRVYFPAGVQRNEAVVTAIAYFNRGKMDDAFDSLQNERQLVASYEFTPYYYLVIYYLEQGDSQAARDLIENWQTENENELQALNYQVLVDAALARVDLYDAGKALASGSNADDLLTDAGEHLANILDNQEGRGDVNFADAYLLEAQRLSLDNQYDDALDLLSAAINNRFYDNTELRLERARIYHTEGRYVEALHELADILVINPFLEAALLEQISVALDSGQAGLGVLFSEQYLLYYPGSVRGYYLLGQAREAENKAEQAITAYSRALLAPETEPGYLDALRSRAALYLEQGRFDLAEADLSEAMALTSAEPEIQAQRMQAAFVSGDYETALADAETLLGSGAIPDSDILLIKGQILVQQETYREGLDALQQALSRGLAADKRPLANEYIARADLGLNNTRDALAAIELALADGETATRRYLRGQIYEAQARRSGANADFTAALIDYEFVLTWGQFYSYPFIADAQTNYDAVLQRLGRR